jgi:hypothetical protein
MFVYPDILKSPFGFKHVPCTAWYGYSDYSIIPFAFT